MFLNTLKPAAGSKKNRKRVARGIGSGWGKTAGRGHKGQKSRSNSFSSIGFEGGQMPLQRRLPKVGFTSRKSLVTQEIRLSELNKVEDGAVSIESLKAAGLIRKSTLFVKVMLSGEINKAVNVEDEDVRVSKGAAEAISAAGGKVA